MDFIDFRHSSLVFSKPVIRFLLLSLCEFWYNCEYSCTMMLRNKKIVVSSSVSCSQWQETFLQSSELCSVCILLLYFSFFFIRNIFHLSIFYRYTYKLNWINHIVKNFDDFLQFYFLNEIFIKYAMEYWY